MRNLLLAFVAMALAGCQAMSGYPPSPLPIKDALASVETDSSVAAETPYDQATDPNVRRTLRDRIIRSRIYIVDLQYNEFARSLNTEQKAFAVGSDLLVLGLAGAGTLAKSTTTKTRLAAWSAGVLGGRASIDKEIYFNKTLPAIVAQMDASRRTVMADLTAGMSLPEADYPLVAAKSDLERYYIAGTLPGALSAITKEAGKQSDVADKKIERIVEAKYAYTEAGRRIRTYWKPDGTTIDAAHAQVLNNWLAANANGVSIGSFVNGAGTPAQQAALIAALSIP